MKKLGMMLVIILLIVCFTGCKKETNQPNNITETETQTEVNTQTEDDTQTEVTSLEEDENLDVTIEEEEESGIR